MPLIRVALAAVIGLLAPAGLMAQVGHPPSKSPYHDIKQGSSITLVGGHFLGNGGDAGVGPNDGWTFGGRFDFRSARALAFGVGVSYGQLQRLIVDPFLDEVTGPVDQSVLFTEAMVTFNLTGGKTWHAFAPFVGLTIGFAFGSDVAADTSGYDFGTKFFFAPGGGTRVFLGDRLHLRAEARAHFWKLTYPPSFRQQPDPVIITGADSEWDLSPWILFGIGYTL